MRNTALPAKVMGIDLRGVLLIMLWALHMRWWTLWVCIIGIGFLAVASLNGLSVPAAFRGIRSRLAGSSRTARRDNTRTGKIDHECA